MDKECTSAEYLLNCFTARWGKDLQLYFMRNSGFLECFSAKVASAFLACFIPCRTPNVHIQISLVGNAPAQLWMYRLRQFCHLLTCASHDCNIGSTSGQWKACREQLQPSDKFSIKLTIKEQTVQVLCCLLLSLAGNPGVPRSPRA